MIEIAKCKCGCSAGVTYRNVHKSILAVQCNSGVCWCGPDDDSAERAISEWNALMASQSVAPKAGTVRVRIPVHQMNHGYTFLIECQITSDEIIDCAPASLGVPIAYVLADLPISGTVEVVGRVES